MDSDSSNQKPSSSKDPAVQGSLSPKLGGQNSELSQWIVPLAALFIIALLVGYFLTRSSNFLANTSPEPDPLANKREKVPEFQVLSPAGTLVSSHSYLGKVLMIGFWQSDCSQCLLEIPAFNTVYKKYRGNGLEVIEINLDEKEVGEKVQKDVWSRGNYKILSFLDPQKTTAKILQVETLPSAIVLDKKGRLAFHSYGSNDWQSPETSRLIEDLLLEEE